LARFYPRGTPQDLDIMGLPPGPDRFILHCTLLLKIARQEKFGVLRCLIAGRVRIGPNGRLAG